MIVGLSPFAVSYLTATSKNVEFFDKLPELVKETDNTTIHRTIKIKPCNANRCIDFDVVVNLINPNSILLTNFNIGGHVQISKYKNIFKKGYQSSWTKEVFVIEKVKDTTWKICVTKGSNRNVNLKCNPKKSDVSWPFATFCRRTKKYGYYGHISLTGTNHCYSKLSKNIYLEKTSADFFQYFWKYVRKSKSKGCFFKKNSISINGGKITCTFHEQELQKTKHHVFRIEKVIKKKGDKLCVK